MGTTRWILGAGVASLVVAGCMSASMGTGLSQLSPDTYRLSRVDGVGQYPDAAALQAAIVDEANAFARSQGKVAVPIAAHAETMRTGHLLTADYEFRLAAPGEAAAPTAVDGAQSASRPPEAQTPVAAVAAAAGTTPVAPVAPVTAVTPVTPVAAVAPVAPVAPAAKPEAPHSLYDELVMLDDLRKRGILTDAEFQALKTKLLAGK